jgi:hypothetical protein
MAAGWLESIDWSRPWLKPLLPMGVPVANAASWRNALNDAASSAELRNHRGLPIQFVAQEELPTGVAYERFISDTGLVPTRDNLHDFFNALVWLTYPRIKVQLNALQAAEIERRAGMPQEIRGRVRDAATIFDENAALLVISEESLGAALREHAWQHLFVERRANFIANSELRLFGHALLEKLVFPYKAITAHVWIVSADRQVLSSSEDQRRAWADKTVAATLRNGLNTSDFTPLPVLGMPDWWPGQDADFYADDQVFRPRREKAP